MTEQTLDYIPITKIKPDPNNPRKTFGEDEHAALVESVKQHGIQTPLRVRRNGDGDSYVIVAGERRWRAAKEAKLKTVPAIVSEHDTATVESLVENLVREDLNPIEEGDAYSAMTAAGKTVTEIAELVSRSAERVEERIKLSCLPTVARDAVVAGEVRLGTIWPLAEIASVYPAMADALAWACVQQGGWGMADRPWQLYYNLDREANRDTIQCPDCEGQGYTLDGEQEDVECAKCEGSGQIPSTDEAVNLPPTFFAVPIGNYGQVPLFESMMLPQLTEDAQARLRVALDKAAAKHKTLQSWESPPPPIITADAGDVAVAAGVVVQIGSAQVVTDPEWVSEYLPELYEAAVEQYVTKKKTSGATAGRGAGGQTAMDDEEKAKRADEREKAKAARAKARTYNVDLGHAIVTQLGEVPVTLEAVKLLVGTILDHTETEDYRGTRGSGHALFHRFTGEGVFPATKAGDLKVPRSADDRTEFVKGVYKRTRKELSAAKTSEQALGVLARFLAHGLANLEGLPNADLQEMFPYRAKGLRKFVLGQFTPAFRKRVPKASGIPGRSYAWDD